MTREEAAHILEYSRIVSENFTQEAVTATYVMALAALRGPTREQVDVVIKSLKLGLENNEGGDVVYIPKFAVREMIERLEAIENG